MWKRIALSRHPTLESAEHAFGANAHARMTGAQIVAAHQAGSLSYDHVGRKGGAGGPAFASDVSNGSWLGTTCEIRLGALPGNANWFSVQQFLTQVLPDAQG